MWNSSRRWALLVVAVLVLGTGAYGLGWIGKPWPIEVGQTETGEIADGQNPNGEPEGSEPGLLALDQSEPAQPLTDDVSEFSGSRLVLHSQSEPAFDQTPRSSLGRRGFESLPADETTQPLFGARPAAELPNQFPTVENSAETGVVRRPRTGKPVDRRVATQDTT